MMLLAGDVFVDCNPAAVEMFACSDKKQLLSLHPSDLFPEKQPDGSISHEKGEEHIAKAIDQGSNRFEWLHRRINGDIFPAEVLLTSIPVQGEKIIHATLKDISERKQTEEELRKELKLRKDFFQLASAFLVIIGRNGKTIMMNEAMLCATGYKLDEVVGQDYSHIPYAGQVDVAVKKACALRVRIPEWTQSGEVRCTVNGEARPLNWDGRYALIGEVREGDLVSVCFPIAERTAEVNIEKHCYTLILRGSEVVKIDPPGQFCPLYQRDYYRHDDVRWRKMTRFVPDEQLIW